VWDQLQRTGRGHTPLPEVYRYTSKMKGSDDESNANGELRGLLQSLYDVNRGGNTSQLWATVVGP